MSRIPPAEIPSFETRLSRYAADTFYMPAHCRNRECRRTGTCRGYLSASGEPRCIEPLADHKRRLFASHAELVRVCAKLLHADGDFTPTGDRDQRHAFHRCLLVAIRAFADLPVNRPPLRRRLRRQPLPPIGPPPRGSAVTYYEFGIPDTEPGSPLPFQEIRQSDMPQPQETASP